MLLFYRSHPDVCIGIIKLYFYGIYALLCTACSAKYSTISLV